MKTKDILTPGRDHFTFFRSFREQIDLCSEGEQLRLYRAITDYALLHKDTEFQSPMLQMAWLGIKPHLESGWQKFSAGQAGGEAGKGVSRNVGNDFARKSKTKAEQKENRTYSNVKDSNNKESTIVPKKNVSLHPSEEEKKFSDWMLATFPHVQRMEQPLTLEQFKKLGIDYGKDDVLETLQRMENWKPLLRQNRSAYRTAQKWITTKK